MMLLIDVSGSREFGSFEKLKKNVITELSAILSFSAIQNNDKIGVIFFSDKIEKFIPPKKGKSHILRIIRELIDFYPESKGTDISEAVRYLTNAIKKRCTAFIISDFVITSYSIHYTKLYDIRQLCIGGRDKPCSRKSSVGFARSDAGTSDYNR